MEPINAVNTTNTLNVKGIKKHIVSLIKDKKIDDIMPFFKNNNENALDAIKEYNVSSHSIMFRANKIRADKSDYNTNKLPQNWQQYINEVAVFFFLGKPLKFELVNDFEEAEKLKGTFQLFKKFLDELYFDSNVAQAKRIAGAETESAILFNIYHDIDTGEDKVKMQILANSNGDKLLPCFNKYGDMKAFAHKYETIDISGDIQSNIDIYTSDVTYLCVRKADSTEWDIDEKENPIGKIPIIYIKQPKEWEGAEARIERIEWADSKNADTIEYFADPYLKISKKVANKLADAKEVGKVIEVTNKDDVFEYVTPNEASTMKSDERKMLKETILQSTFTPDLSYENIKGMGAISGEAIGKANILATIKANNRKSIYNELFSRMVNIILAIMKEIKYPKERSNIEKMLIRFIYQSPFGSDLDDNSAELSRLRDAGLLSVEAGVYANRNVDNKEEEIKRLKKEQLDKTKNTEE